MESSFFFSSLATTASVGIKLSACLRYGRSGFGGCGPSYFWAEAARATAKPSQTIRRSIGESNSYSISKTGGAYRLTRDKDLPGSDHFAARRQDQRIVGPGKERQAPVAEKVQMFLGEEPAAGRGDHQWVLGPVQNLGEFAGFQANQDAGSLDGLRNRCRRCRTSTCRHTITLSQRAAAASCSATLRGPKSARCS